jgi:hypothetical protein
LFDSILLIYIFDSGGFTPRRDRTLIYAVVEQGEVSAKDGITAIQHRKSGSHY